jgi:hypothetical protein
MGCGASKTHVEVAPMPVEEAICPQTPPKKPIHHAFVVPPLVRLEVPTKAQRADSAGSSLTLNMIQRKRAVGEYVACEGTTVRATTTGSKSSIWSTITMRTTDGGVLLKIKKAILNEVNKKLATGGEAEEHPTYSIYRKVKMPPTESSAVSARGVMGGLAAMSGAALSAASEAASKILDIDSDADIAATLMRVKGTSKEPGATWQLFDGKVAAADLRGVTRPRVLYEYFEDAAHSVWTIRNSHGSLVGKGWIDWDWRPTEDVAKVEPDAKFASMRLELGAGVDMALTLAGVIGIDDFDDKIWESQPTDAAVEFGRQVKAAMAAVDRVIHGGDPHKMPPAEEASAQ